MGRSWEEGPEGTEEGDGAVKQFTPERIQEFKVRDRIVRKA